MLSYSELEDFAMTDLEKERLQKLSEGFTQAQVAKLYDVSLKSIERTVGRVRRRASQVLVEEKADEQEKLSPSEVEALDQDSSNPLLGTTTLYDGDGEVKLRWVKDPADKQRQELSIRKFAEGFLGDSKPMPYTPYHRPKNATAPTKDKIPFFYIGDAHIGLAAHMSQVNHHFDLEIASNELKLAMREQIDRAPLTERCTIVDVGDFSHAENMEGMTQHSGHLLDMAAPFGRIIRTCAEIFRDMIDYAAQKFEKVDIIVNQGNHSRTNDLWMCVFLEHVYSLNDRITVLNNESVFIPYRFGKNFMMFHHGDKCKGNKLIDVMKTDFPDDWGESRYRYIVLGHVHHRSVAKEHAGVVMESFNQLAPADSYAHDGGWRSRSCLTTVVYHRHYGEKQRYTITAEEIKDLIEDLPEGTTSNYRRPVHTV